MTAYYNENDQFAAVWLRELIKAKLITDGEVDERSIELVQPADLRSFVQCHFFAGIGGWSYALRLAGWPDERAVWTGSCPCQPFSSAGKGDGTADSRHLWPAWFRLIRECRPVVVFGEQVASADGLGWFDRVSTDLEGTAYAVGAVDLCAAGVGAFHIRQRLWFVADAGRAENLQREGVGRSPVAESDESHNGLSRRSRGELRELADAEYAARRPGSERRGDDLDEIKDGPQGASRPGEHCAVGELADTEAIRLRQGCADAPRSDEGAGSQGARFGLADDGGCGGLADATGRDQRRYGGESRSAADACGDEAWEADGHTTGSASTVGHACRAGLSNGEWPELRSARRWSEGRAVTEPSRSFWTDCDWLPCIDGKARPVEPGTFPLAHGLPGRVGRLRGYGNAINPQTAQVFIEAYLDARTGVTT